MNYDAEKLAIELVSHRRGRLQLNLRQAAAQIGVSYSVVQKAERKLPIGEKSYGKICTWLGRGSGEYFKNETG